MVRVLGVLCASVLVLAACGGGATAPTSAPAGGGTAAAEGAVTAEGFKFSPQTLDVKVGAKVTWTNKDGAPHTTTSGTPASKDGKWEGQLPAGGTFSFTFAQAGTFSFFCAIHNSMTGTVVVK